MFDGHCAYCGCTLKDESGKYMHIDHIEPLRRHWFMKGCLNPENETEVNLFPSCPQCNRYKGTMFIDQFRSEVKQALKRLEKSASYRNALRFGMIEIKEWDGVFYFEKCKSI
jgi:5-methylcytosine-specific restriction endonuclease McrA